MLRNVTRLLITSAIVGSMFAPAASALAVGASPSTSEQASGLSETAKSMMHASKMDAKHQPLSPTVIRHPGPQETKVDVGDNARVVWHSKLGDVIRVKNMGAKSATSPSVNDIKPLDIIARPRTKDDLYGGFGRVLSAKSISKSGEVELKIGNAALSEVIPPSADLKYSEPISAKDTLSEQPTTEVKDTKRCHKTKDVLIGFQCEFAPEGFKPNHPPTPALGIYAQLDNPEAIFEYKPKKFPNDFNPLHWFSGVDLSPNPFEAGIKAKYKTGYQIDGNFSLKKEWSGDIASVSDVKTFFAGPIPIVVKYDVTLKWFVNAEGKLSITGGRSIEGDLQAGVRYADDHWSVIRPGPPTVVAKPWTIEGMATAKAGLSFDAQILLYGVVGPAVNVTPYLAAEAKATLSASGLSGGWKVYVGLDIVPKVVVDISLPSKVGGVTIPSSILGFKLAGRNIFHTEAKVWPQYFKWVIAEWNSTTKKEEDYQPGKKTAGGPGNQIRNVKGLCLDSNGAAEGKQAVMYPCDPNNANQAWNIFPTKPGQPEYVLENQGMCLESNGALHAKVTMHRCESGNSNQFWNKGYHVVGKYGELQLQSASNLASQNECLDNNGGEKGNGVWLTNCMSRPEEIPAQAWFISPLNGTIQVEPGYENCPKGYFCVWPETEYKGTGMGFPEGASVSNLTEAPFFGAPRSADNNTQMTYCVYGKPDFDFFNKLPAQRGYTDYKPYVASFQPERPPLGVTCNEK